MKKTQEAKKFIFVVRRGSGWGGFIGSYIIDLGNKVIAKYDEMPIDTTDMIKYATNGHYLSSSVSFNEDLSLLWQMGWNCKKEKLPVSMDDQLDTITLYDGSEIDVIYDTYLKNIKPLNTALDGKIIALLNYLVAIFPNRYS